MSKVLVAFSGGVDSANVVERLSDQGHEVTAMTLDMTGSREVIETACRKAEELGVRFFVKDVRERFRQYIVNYFVESYGRGETPAPCTRCNPMIKWSSLAEEVRPGGYDYIATGHYFGVEELDGKRYVVKADDARKDQSYYLWGLDQHMLSLALTPMRHVIKTDIIKQGSQRESMGVCFLAGMSCAEFLGANGGSSGQGEIVNKRNEVIGTHDGTIFYTPGQKKGLSLPQGMCVVGIDAANNRLIAGHREDLFFEHLEVSDINAPDLDRLLACDSVTAVIRGIGLNPQGTVKLSYSAGRIFVSLSDPAWAPAIGQPVVFYNRGTVLGGGYLTRYY